MITDIVITAPYVFGAELIPVLALVWLLRRPGLAPWREALRKARIYPAIVILGLLPSIYVLFIAPGVGSFPVMGSVVQSHPSWHTLGKWALGLLAPAIAGCWRELPRDDQRPMPIWGALLSASALAWLNAVALFTAGWIW